MSRIAANLDEIRDRIARAAARVGRSPEEIRLCAVTKKVGLPEVREAYALGCRVFGESRVQEAEEKVGGDVGGRVEWHMIGHLQRNKARRAVDLFDVIQSLDGVPLARRLSSLAEERGKRLPVFLEILTSSEGTKGGLAMDAADEAVSEIGELPGLELRGLMTMAPFTEDERSIRDSFGSLRRLRERLGGEERLPELSMGMTGDYELAVEEGSTLVRIGTGIFR